VLRLLEAICCVQRPPKTLPTLGIRLHDELTSTSPGGDHQEDVELFNGNISTLPDSIFRRYKKKNTLKEIWDTLKQDYDAQDPLTQASLEKRLFCATCTDPTKVSKHLDNLIAIMDKLSE
jgi:hypothetical protein